MPTSPIPLVAETPDEGILPPDHPRITKFTPGATCPVLSTSPKAAEDSINNMERMRMRRMLSNGQRAPEVLWLGTRMSKLAQIQTEQVRAALERQWPNIQIKVRGKKTEGDKKDDRPFSSWGKEGKALWTEELENLLQAGDVDAIVHSLKDVPTELPTGFELWANMKREDSSDALVVKQGLPYKSLQDLPDGSIIGTSSVRRVAQLRRAFPKLHFADMRGLVQTRLEKLDNVEHNPEYRYTAIILATAGLNRLGLEHRITSRITSPIFWHAIGQGAIGIEVRQVDTRIKEIIGSLDDWKTSWATRAEREMLRILEGGCAVPIGCETELIEMSGNGETNGAAATVTINGEKLIRPYTSPLDPHAAKLTLTGNITSPSGKDSVKATLSREVFSTADCEALGAAVAQALIQQGGRRILEAIGRDVEVVKAANGEKQVFQVGGRAAVQMAPIRNQNDLSSRLDSAVYA